MVATKKLLLGTTAVLGLCLTASGLPRTASAAEVTPGGALDISLSGFARFRAHGGDLDAARLDDTVSTGLDFSNDTEVHVILSGKDDATGTEYGGTVEFEADTNRSDNTDESWLFVSGGWGELRLGDEDGVLDNSSLGAYSIAAGTGGIDGSVIDVIATKVIKPTDTGDATKIRYYTPSFGGFSLAASYTPNLDGGAGSSSNNGDNVALVSVGAGDVFEGGAIYEGEFSGASLTASLVGLYGEIKDTDPGEDDDYWGWNAGLSAEVFGFSVAGSYWQDKVGDAEKDAVTAGIGASLGPANVSLTAAYLLDADDVSVNGNDVDNALNVVLSADVGLLPGLVLAGDVGYFDNDADYDAADDAGGVGDTDDNGYQGVVSLRLAF